MKGSAIISIVAGMALISLATNPTLNPSAKAVGARAQASREIHDHCIAHGFSGSRE